MSNFYGSVQFYTSPEVYATIGMVSKKMLDNTSSKMVLSSIHLDFQPVAPSYIFQIFLRIAIQNQIRVAQRIIVDEVIQFRPLRHGHVQCILDPGAVNGNFSPIPEQQFHAADIHVIRCYYERGIIG